MSSPTDCGYVFTTDESDWDPYEMDRFNERSDAITEAYIRGSREFWVGHLTQKVQPLPSGVTRISYWVKAVSHHDLTPGGGAA